MPIFTLNAFRITASEYFDLTDPGAVASGSVLPLGAPSSGKFADANDDFLDLKMTTDTSVSVAGTTLGPITDVDFHIIDNQTNPSGDSFRMAALSFSSTTDIVLVQMNTADSFINDPIPTTDKFSSTSGFGSGALISFIPIVDPVITGGGTALQETWLESNTFTVFENFNATDPQGDTEGSGLTWSISGGPDASHFGIVSSNGAAFWNFFPDFENPTDDNGDNVYELTVRVTDDDGNFDEQDVELTVLDSAPVAQPDSFGVAEDGARSGNFLVDNGNGADFDPEGEALKISQTGLFNTDHGTINVFSLGQFIYNPDVNFNGTDTFTYRVEDTNGTESDGVATFTVAPVNDAPAITNPSLSFSMEENGFLAGTVTASDVDAGASLTFSIAGGVDAAQFQIGASSGLLSFINAPDFEAALDQNGDNDYEVLVRVSDGILTDLAQFVVTVTDDPNETSGVTILGTSGADVVDATTSPAGQPLPTALDDVIRGFGGNDELHGLAGNDLIEGGGGSDILLGGDGDDTLDGGAGIDAVSYVGHTGRVVVSLNAGGNTLQGVDTFIDVENLIGTRFNDRLTGDQGDNEIWGRAGNDVLIGLGGDDVLHGEGGNDTLNGSGGDDILNGGAGDDIIDGVGGRDTLNGGAGNDELIGGVGVDEINGGTGDDDVFGNFGVDTISGGDGDDNIRADGSGDIVSGGAGRDRLVGGNGKDTLWGGQGNDILFGGGGHGNGDGLRDVFVFKSAANGGGGFDIIRDFENNVDKIDMTESGYVTAADVIADASQVGANVEINFDFGGLLRINSFTLADLNSGDFLF